MPAEHPAPPRQSARQTRRLIIGCLIAAILMFAGMYTLIHWNVSDQDARQKVIDNCVNTGPYVPSWSQQLQQYGLANKSDQVIEPYCHCMWDDTLKNMSVADIRAFFKAPSEQQTRQLGGQDALTQRHQQCLKSLHTRFAAQP